MVKQYSNLQKINQILNTSSETFMLIALVSLFALPFVVFSNLEPIIKQSEMAGQQVQTAPVAKIKDENAGEEAPIQNIQKLAEIDKSQMANVLGVVTPVEPLQITEVTENFKKFDTAIPVKDEKTYTLNISSNQVFSRTSLFKVSNGSDSTKKYKLEVKNTNTKASTLAKKYLYIGEKQYLLGSKDFPTDFTVEPGKDVEFALMAQLRPTNVSIVVNLVE